MAYKNKEDQVAASRKHYLANREEILSRNVEYQKTSPKRAEFVKKYHRLPEQRQYRRDWYISKWDKFFGFPNGTMQWALDVSIVCPICEQPFDEKFSGTHKVIDHDHDTGDFRGIIHNICNTGIGAFKDNADNLRRAIDYLQPKLE